MLARLRIAVGLFASLLLCSEAGAYEFVPTQSEFAAWPRYCQARYVTTDIGRQQPWAGEYPQKVVDEMIADIGWETFEKLHHYCAGIVWLNRSKLEPDPKQREFDLRSAKAEVLFTLRGMNKDHPIAAPIYVTLALVCRAAKDYACATSTLEEAIERQPSAPEPYSALAVIYRDRDQTKLARETLLRGDAATEGKSPEINYNLGLLLVDLRDYDGAVERAKRAYELGHPLPGLKNKLVRLGKWPTAE